MKTKLNMKYILILAALMNGIFVHAQKSVLLMNATAHIGNGEVINQSLVGIKNGKIVTVANALTTTPNLKEYDTVIYLDGKHVYPGMIATNVTLGLIEVEAVRATQDHNETGTFNPNVRSLIAFNTDSKVIPTVRSNGVLLAQTTPRGGIISGSSSVMKLNGWNWEDAQLKADDGIHLNWPRTTQGGGWWAEPAETQKNDKYAERIAEIKKFFTEAKAYNTATGQKEKDLRFEAMRSIFDGKQNLYIHASFVKEITDAVLFCKEMGVPKIVIVGGYDSWMVTDLLRENNVSVMLRRIHELPQRAEDDIDLPFKLPYLLQKAGILYCLENSGDQESAQSRNIPFLAGHAVGYGLTKEEALASVTLNAAKILGIDHLCGSLEAGKDATLFVSNGDALDMRTNDVVLAYIQGQPVDLNNHQKMLYEKYMKKYGGK